jgi:hypothetical protein
MMDALPAWNALKKTLAKQSWLPDFFGTLYQKRKKCTE